MFKWAVQVWNWRCAVHRGASPVARHLVYIRSAGGGHILDGVQKRHPNCEDCAGWVDV
jgi:hypothetical protein